MAHRGAPPRAPFYPQGPIPIQLDSGREAGFLETFAMPVGSWSPAYPAANQPPPPQYGSYMKVEPFGDRRSPPHEAPEERDAPGKMSRPKGDNRMASKVYRERKKTELKDLQTQVIDMGGQMNQLRQENRVLQQRLKSYEAQLQAAQKDAYEARTEITRLRHSAAVMPHPAAAQHDMYNVAMPDRDDRSSSNGRAGSERGEDATASTASDPQHGKTLFRRMQDMVSRNSASDDEINEILKEFQSLMVKRHVVPAEHWEQVLNPQFLVQNIILNPVPEDLRQADANTREEQRMRALLADEVGLTSDKVALFMDVRDRHQRKMITVLNERMAINRDLRKFLSDKIVYLRWLNVADSSADARDVAAASTLLTKLKATFRTEVDLFYGSIAESSTFLTPMEVLRLNCALTFYNLHTATALHAVIDLMEDGSTALPGRNSRPYLRGP